MGKIEFETDDPDLADEIEDRMEEAMMNCGMTGATNRCEHQGTEYCDWECPFSGQASHNRRFRRQKPPMVGNG